MDRDIGDYIKALEEIGYTHKEAEQLVEEATRAVDISFMDEEFQKVVDAFNNISEEYLVPYSDLVKAIANQKNIVADTIEDISLKVHISEDGVLSARDAKCSDGIYKLCSKDCVYE